MAECEGEVPVTNEQKTYNDKIELNTETSKTDADKAEETQEEADKGAQYESDEFETESESEALKTDEEKVADQNKTDTGDNGETEVKTDDEKLGNDSKGEEEQREDEGEITETKGDNDETVAVGNEGNTEMSDQGDTVKDSQADEAQTDIMTNEGKGDDGTEVSNQEEAKTEEEQEVTNQDVPTEKELESDGHEIPVETKDEENVKGETDDTNEDKKGDVAVDAGPPIEKEDLQSKINENEELALKMESALSNQEAERDAYRKLTEENATLQKHHDDMKVKLDEMEGGHVLLVAEVETLRKVSHEQKETIVKLESEIKLLKETQGGDENVKDMQEKLIRMANEQEEKDRRIHSLEGELDATREKLKDAESRAARGGSSNAQNSKTCIIM